MAAEMGGNLFPEIMSTFFFMYVEIEGLINS